MRPRANLRSAAAKELLVRDPLRVSRTDANATVAAPA